MQKIRLRLKTIIVFLSIAFAGSGQELNTDSIQQVFNNYQKNDSVKVNLMIRLASAYQYVSPDKSITIAQKSYALGKALKDNGAQCRSLNLLATLYTNNGLFDSAVLCQKAIISTNKYSLIITERAYRDLGDIYILKNMLDSAAKCATICIQSGNLNNSQIFIADGYRLLGAVNNSLDNYSSALKYLLNALEIYNETKNQAGLASCYSMIGTVYGRMGKHDKAIVNYLLSLRIRKEIGDKYQMLHSYGHIAFAYARQKMFDTALKYNFLVLELAKKMHNEFMYGTNLAIIGSIYTERGNYTEAIKYLKEAIPFIAKVQAPRYVNAMNLTLAELELSNKHTEKSGFARMETALKYVVSNGDKELAKTTAFVLKEKYKELHNFEKALKYSEMESAYTDSVKDEKTNKYIRQLEVNYDLEKKNNTINRLEKTALIASEKNKEKNYAIGGILIILIMLTITYMLLLKKNQLISKQKEEMQRGVTVLNELNLFKDRMLSILSHDLRVPLASLQSILDLLNAEMLKSEDLAFYKEHLGNQLSSINLFIDSVLLWASIPLRNNANQNKEKLNVKMLADQAINLLLNTAEGKKIHIDNQIPDAITLNADRNEIDTVIRNLLNNALKFTPMNGRITLSASQNTDVVHISIADTGIGMTEQQMKDILSVGSVLVNGTNNEKGIGLGLLLCKDFVKANGGEITVQSTIGEGSKFTVTLPAAA